MKRSIYITMLSLLTLSCAKNAKEASMGDGEYLETEAVGTSEIKAVKGIEFSSLQLAEAKLNEYFELILLRQKHPEFGEDISAQIKNLSKQDLSLADSATVRSIENIRQKGEIAEVSDSLQKIQFYFDLVTENGTHVDSIVAVIRSQKVMVEQQHVIATKVTFEKN